MSGSIERAPLLGTQQPTTHSTPLRRTAFIAGAFLNAGGAVWAAYNTWKNWSGGGTANNIATSIEAFGLAACFCILCISKARTPLRSRTLEEASPLLNDVTARTHETALGEIDGRLAYVITKRGATIEDLSSDKTLAQLIEEKIVVLDRFLQAIIAERDQNRTGSEQVLSEFAALKERCKTLLPELAVTSSPSTARPLVSLLSPAAPAVNDAARSPAPAAASLSPVDAEALRRKLFEELDAFQSKAQVRLSSAASSAASTPQRSAAASSAPAAFGTPSPLSNPSFGTPGKETV